MRKSVEAPASPFNSWTNSAASDIVYFRHPSLRGGEADEAIHRDEVDCFASLAMTLVQSCGRHFFTSASLG